MAWLFVLAARSPEAVSAWTAVWDNISLVWDAGFGGALATSLWTSLVVGTLTTALALLAAFALATCRNRLLKTGSMLLLAIGLFQPMSVLIIPLFAISRSLGLLNTLPGVVAPQIGRALALGILLLWVGIRSLPGGVLEAAATDGARPFSVLMQIVLPLLRPLLLVTAVWSFLLSWNDYLLPTVVLAGGDSQTAPLALAHFVGRFDTEYGLLATGTLVTIVPILLLYAVLYRALARGMRRLHI